MPFSLYMEPCVKCGFIAYPEDVQYVAVGEKLGGGVTAEYLVRSCRTCRYEWAVPCKDAEEI